MSLATLLFWLFVVGMPLAMMFMHRGGHGGGMGGCGGGHAGHGTHTDTATNGDTGTSKVITGEVLDAAPARPASADHSHHGR